MSAGVLLGMGAFVTLLVAIGVGLPLYGAVLDGRDLRRRKTSRRAAETHEPSERRAARRRAA